MVNLTRIERHDVHQRLRRCVLDVDFLHRSEALLSANSADQANDPGSKKKLLVDIINALMPDLVVAIRTTILDRTWGGMMVEWSDSAQASPAAVEGFAESLSNAIGTLLPETRNTDGRPMEPQDFVHIRIGYLARNAGALLHFADPTLPWPLHTDRSLHEDVGDYLLVCKVEENDASGGRIRLLHLDDFSLLDRFVSDELGWRDLKWKGDERLAPPWEQARLRHQPGVRAPVFSKWNGMNCIRYTDSRFRRPDTLEHMNYLSDLGDALENDGERLPVFHLPLGSLYIINNRFMLHGREGFANEAGFSRRLLRFCGNFRGDPGMLTETPRQSRASFA